jgi:SM-20-related protein
VRVTDIEDSAAFIAGAIVERGYVIVPHFLGAELVASLRDCAQSRDARSEFRSAGVGSGASRQELPEVRGDRIRWLDPADAGAAEREVLERLDSLRASVNRETFCGLFSLECHYAIYPPGAGYQRHLDRFRDSDARMLSVVLYLNEDWTPADGGQLVLHLDEGGFEVLPAGGTLVAFLSARFEHEVRPAKRERLSLTGWFRRRE